MERLNNKIIYLSDGEIMHFFYSAKSGICINDKGGAKSLLADAYSDFDVCLFGGEIYLICQNADGDIIFLKYFDSKWHKYTILISKNKLAYDKHFCLVPTGSCVQLYYTIKSGEKTLLVQQILEGGTNPSVIAQITEGANPFCVLVDSELNTYIYYQNERLQFGYKIYRWSAKAAGEFILLADFPVSSVYAVSENKLHHICTVSGDEIVYMRRSLTEKNLITKEISRIEIPAESIPYVSVDKDSIYIVWHIGKMVMYAKSTDGGKTFCSPARLVTSGDAPVLFGIRKSGASASALGYFFDSEIRFFRIGSANSIAPPAQNRNPIRPIYSDNPELMRLKNAVAMLGGEVSDLKNRLEMLESFFKDRE